MNTSATTTTASTTVAAARTMTTTSSRVTINRAIQLLDLFRTEDSTMPIGEAIAFLLVAQGESRDGGGLNITELKDRGGFTLATASRYTQALSKKDRHGELGKELISNERDPMSDRQKILRVSNKGRTLIHKIETVLEGA